MFLPTFFWCQTIISKGMSYQFLVCILHQVAAALKEGRKVEPESYSLVTIFFSDIVGFTNISSTLPPYQVMELLDRLYQALDALTKKYDLFKVSYFILAAMHTSEMLNLGCLFSITINGLFACQNFLQNYLPTNFCSVAVQFCAVCMFRPPAIWHVTQSTHTACF